MNKICRFCHHPSAFLFYPATNKGGQKLSSHFACTSCTMWGGGVHGPIVKCNNCKILYVDEPITQKEISDFYQQTEDPLYLQEQQARQRTFQHYLNSMEKLFPTKGRLLDVGTNTGLFIKVALESGWDAYGLEPGKQAVEYAKKNFGIKLIAKPFETNTFSPQSFDAITMWDVVEHFTDPIAELKKVYRALRPGGMFAFSTVDPYSFVAKIQGERWPWYMEMHRVLLGRETALKYLREVGFVDIIFTSHWRFFSLGYTAKLWKSISPALASVFEMLGKELGISKVIVPYFAEDLYNCYAFKKS